MSRTTLPILEQRRIEANIIKPIYDEMVARLGKKSAQAILSAAITKDSIAQGKAYSADMEEEGSLEDFHALLPQWKADGALEVDMLEENASHVHYNVTRCKYAEMYRDMGLAEIGGILSCGRDGTFCTGFNPNIKLDRSQTIMQGASHCDFRYRWEEDDAKKNYSQ
ncbi:MAG: L-2-amino-thiazoline-4-carboxylic acid hydrolase [Hyphomicrobiales bacterium]